MVRVAIGPVIHEIDRLYGSGTSTGLDEGQLLDRFLGRGEEGAFEAIVRRHGPMVLAVCRRLLRDPNDAEDAFQATFLVLVKKAPSLRRRELLANWLYGVAFRVASRVRVDAARRRRKEEEARGRTAESFEEPAMTTADADSGPALFEEVRRLPEKYRAPVVLCYLEGRTHEEAALLLKWPVGTVKGRLARARDLLQKRLSRRGVVMPSAAVGTWLAAETASAAVPPALVMSTVKAAAAMAAGGALASGALPGPALALAQGASRTMFLTKWTSIVGTVLATCGLATGGVAFFPGAQEGGAEGVAAAGQEKATGEGEEKGKGVQEFTSSGGWTTITSRMEDPLLTQLAEAARKRLEVTKEYYDRGTYTIQSYVQASRMLAEAEAKRARGPGGRAEAYREHADRMASLMERSRQREKIGIEDPAAIAEAEYEHAWAGLRQKELGEGDQSGEGIEAEVVEGVEGGIAIGGGIGRGPGSMAGGEVREVQKETMSGMGGGMGTGAAMGNMGGGGAMGGGMAGMGGGGSMGGGSIGVGATSYGGMSGRILVSPPSEPAPSAFDQFPEALARSQKTMEILDSQLVSLPFESETPLQEVIQYLRQVTTEEDRPEGLPVYVDQLGLQNAEQTMQSPVMIKLDGIPLRTGLWLLLRQLNLAYAVIDGIVVISNPEELSAMLSEGPVFDAKRAKEVREELKVRELENKMRGGAFQ